MLFFYFSPLPLGTNYRYWPKLVVKLTKLSSSEGSDKADNWQRCSPTFLHCHYNVDLTITSLFSKLSRDFMPPIVVSILQIIFQYFNVIFLKLCFPIYEYLWAKILYYSIDLTIVLIYFTIHDQLLVDNSILIYSYFWRNYSPIFE